MHQSTFEAWHRQGNQAASAFDGGRASSQSTERGGNVADQHDSLLRSSPPRFSLPTDQLRQFAHACDWMWVHRLAGDQSVPPRA